MSWNPILVAGVGIGVYAVGSVLKLASGKKKHPRRTALPKVPGKEPDQNSPVTEPPKPQPGLPAIREEIIAAPEPVKTKEDVAKKASAPNKANRNARSRTSSPKKKSWFLIRLKTGEVRVCQAWGKTPKTIAGPFLSRAAALRAKQA